MTENKEIAYQIVKKLIVAGYIAYYAGGSVRDFILGHPSDDIDIATNAPPSVILDLFPQTIAVGIQFGVVIVVIKGHAFEVSTFRKDLEQTNGRHPGKIELAEEQEDALRRDFTINGLFYDPINEKIIDYVGGVEDLKKGIIRTIGDPFERFYEDRLRMMRAFRFSARFDYPIDKETEEAIYENASSLFPSVAVERVFNEFTKMSKYPRFDKALLDMHRLGLLSIIFPDLKHLHLNDLKSITAHFATFLKDSPTILYLIELFEKASLEKLLSLGDFFKLSNQDKDLITFTFHAKKLLAKEVISDVDLVSFYASPFHSWLVPTDKYHSITWHEENKDRLKNYIERHKNKKPVVTANFLMSKGLKPGKEMGKLLKEAEILSIVKKVEDREQIYQWLKESK